MSFLNDCAAKILEHAGPFSTMSEAARTGLSDYLERKPTGQKETRIGMFGSSAAKGRPEFFWTLGFVGMFACDHGRRRIAYDAAMGKVPSLDLELSDLLYAERIVAMKSTIACPDIPD